MNEPKLIDPSQTAARLDAASRIVITTHTRADGDAVGSMAALQRVLRQRGKDVTAYLHETILDRYAFLQQLERLSEWGDANSRDVLAGADLILVVDTCAVAQLGEIAAAIKTIPVRRLAIDHHVTRDDVVDEAIIDQAAGSCSQIIVRLCDLAGWPIDAETATLLFAGMATDTGWFRFSNADQEAFAIAARLVGAGAKPAELYERLYLNDCEARLRLIGEVLSSFELHADGRLAVIRITQAMLKRCGATREMTEEVINEPQRMGDVTACLLLVEPEGSDPVRISFRSKRLVNVAAIASQFGGGGHKRAAGARVPGTIDSVAAQVIPVMVRAALHAG
ncbi:MAG: bifunctional oligoribonuclease/PAP phosphatase NrnA [Planctomycetota bacterium]